MEVQALLNKDGKAFFSDDPFPNTRQVEFTLLPYICFRDGFQEVYRSNLCQYDEATWQLPEPVF